MALFAGFSEIHCWPLHVVRLVEEKSYISNVGFLIEDMKIEEELKRESHPISNGLRLIERKREH